MPNVWNPEHYERIAPGVYVDRATHDLHFDIGAMLRAAGIPDSVANRDVMATTARDLFAERFPGVPITED